MYSHIASIVSIERVFANLDESLSAKKKSRLQFTEIIPLHKPREKIKYGISIFFS